jgi:hypothetical protein
VLLEGDNRLFLPRFNVFAKIASPLIGSSAVSLFIKEKRSGTKGAVLTGASKPAENN